MIPRIIHYAWFGSEVPQSLSERINEWKTVLPDWQFILWNEKNYDLNKFAFTRKMYHQNQLGYVADELRYDVLYEFGGFYLDTDMIIKKELTRFLDKKMVWGFLYKNSIATSFIGSEPHQKLLKDILDVYEGKKFPELQKQSFQMTSNPFVTKIFKYIFSEFKCNGELQEITPNIMIYPLDFFTYQSRNIQRNFAEHQFDNSWGTANIGIKGKIKLKFKRLFPYCWAKISAYRGIKSATHDGNPLER